MRDRLVSFHMAAKGWISNFHFQSDKQVTGQVMTTMMMMMMMTLMFLTVECVNLIEHSADAQQPP